MDQDTAYGLLPEEIRALLRKFLQGECTPQEEREIKKYLNANYWRPEVQALIQNWWAVPHQLPEAQLEAAHAKLMARIRSRGQLSNPLQLRRIPTLYQGASWLAAALLLLALGYSGYQLQLRKPPVIPDQVAAAPDTAALLPRYTPAVSAPVGKLGKLTLTDGSFAEVNSVSKLAVAHQYGITSREVRLIGEAFFTVQKDSSRPFIVHTEEVEVTVLGTSFNVRCFAEERVTTITTATGKVRVKLKKLGREQVLTAGEGLVYEHTTGKVFLKNSEPEKIALWRKGILLFDHTSLLQVARELERYYGTQVKLDNALLASCTYSGEFKHKTLQEVLAFLAYNGSFTYTFQKDGVVLSGGVCSSN